MDIATIKELTFMVIRNCRGMFDPEEFVCRFYALFGYCKEGEQCYLPHRNEVGQIKDNVCRYFLHGYCRNGRTCVNDHVYFKTVRGKEYMYVKDEQLLERASCFSRLFYSLLTDIPMNESLAARVLATTDMIIKKLARPEDEWDVPLEYRVNTERIKLFLRDIIKCIETNEPDATVLHKGKIVRTSFFDFFYNFSKCRIKEHIMSGNHSVYKLADIPIPEVQFSPNNERKEDIIDVSFLIFTLCSVCE